MYIVGQPPLYITYVCLEKIEQGQYQETLEAAGNKGNKSE